MSFNGSGKVLTLWGEWRNQLKITSLEMLGYGASNRKKNSILVELVANSCGRQVTTVIGQGGLQLKIEWQSIKENMYSEVRSVSFKLFS